MAMKKKILGIACLSLGAFGSALAVDNVFEAESANLGLLQNVRSTLELRQIHEEKGNTSADSNDLTGRIGYANGPVDMDLWLSAVHKADTATAQQKTTELEVFVTALNVQDVLKGQVFSVIDSFKNDDKFEDGTMSANSGFRLISDYTMPTKAGDVTVGGYYRAGVLLYDRDQQIKTTGKDGSTYVPETYSLNLLADGNGGYTSKAKAPSTTQKVVGDVKFAPSAVEGLVAEVRLAYENLNVPRHEADALGNVTVAKDSFGFAKYAINEKSMTRLRLTYDVNDKVYLRNDFELYNSKVGDKYSFANFVSVGASVL